jgi:hypothetical protein
MLVVMHLTCSGVRSGSAGFLELRSCTVTAPRRALLGVVKSNEGEIDGKNEHIDGIGSTYTARVVVWYDS